MGWLQDVYSGFLKGIDLRGRLRLDQNNGVPVPIDQIPQTEIDHINLLNSGTNTHAQIDTFIASHTHKSKTLLLFGYGDMILLGPSESQFIDARTVDGALNTRGYRMLRSGTVTGMSLQCLCNEDAGSGLIIATVQKNGTNTAMIIEIEDALGELGAITTDNAFDFAAGDQINVELYAEENGISGDLEFSHIAIVVEIELETQSPTTE